MYQKCPTCKSKGILKKNQTCSTCLGERIIHKENGLPPSKQFISYPTFAPVYPWFTSTYIGDGSISAPNNIATLT